MSPESPRKNATDKLEWVMAAPAHASDLRDTASEPPLKVLTTEQTIDSGSVAAIRELRLYAPATDPMRQFPASIASLENLRCLAIGPNVEPKMLAGIGGRSIPPSVTALGVFTSGVAASWPGAVELPNVTDLRTDGALAFEHLHFPSLRAVSVYPTRSGKNFEAVLQCRELNELQLLTVADNQVFGKMAHLPLALLGLLGGKLPTLDGIELLGGITWLRLHNLRNLTSISAICGLERLEELEIRYCKSIQDIECLAGLTSLRRLQVVACGKLGLDKIGLALKRLDNVMISASS